MAKKNQPEALIQVDHLDDFVEHRPEQHLVDDTSEQHGPAVSEDCNIASLEDREGG